MSGDLIFRPHWRHTAEAMVAAIDEIVAEYHKVADIDGMRGLAIGRIKALGFSEADAIRWLDARRIRAKPKPAQPQGSPVATAGAAPPFPCPRAVCPRQATRTGRGAPSERRDAHGRP